MSVVAPKIAYPHIVEDPQTSGGQPVVEGSRIPVATLIRAHRLGMDLDEILVQYPSLGPAELHAALLYYFDHQEHIDRLLDEADMPPAGADTLNG